MNRNENYNRKRDPEHVRVVTGWLARMVRELGYNVSLQGNAARLVVDLRDIDVVTALRILEAFTFDPEEALDGVLFEATHVDAIARAHLRRKEVTPEGRAMLACVDILGAGWDEESLTYRPGEVVGEERNALVAFMQACGRGDVVAQLWKEK